MSNEFLCRGKRVDTHRWVDGYYVKLLVNAVEKAYLHLIIGKNDGEYNSVDVETVGRCTGLVDKNGLTIFEGDIIKWHDKWIDCDFVGVVEFDHCSAAFKARFGNESIPFLVVDCEYVIKAGNIHDNPELLGGTENELDSSC